MCIIAEDTEEAYKKASSKRKCKEYDVYDKLLPTVTRTLRSRKDASIDNYVCQFKTCLLPLHKLT